MLLLYRKEKNSILLTEENQGNYQKGDRKLLLRILHIVSNWQKKDKKNNNNKEKERNAKREIYVRY